MPHARSPHSPSLIRAALLALAVSLPVHGPVHGEETTPFGAILAGDGAFVPAWDGGIAEPPVDYGGPGTMHPDPYADDAPLAALSAGDLGEFEELLPAGLRGLLERYPDTARIPVYPSHRTHAAPQRVYDGTRANADTAKLIDGGNGFEGARAGIPFPAPTEPLEIYWNHVARWRGEGVESNASDYVIYPDGKVARRGRETLVRFDYYLEDGEPNRLFSLLSRVTAPPKLAGGGVLVLETLNQDAESRSAWSWDAGRRRALRAPLLEFDQAIASADGLVNADDADLVNGSPSRFEWKLLGRRAMVVPYNNYALAAADRDTLFQPGHLDPAATRYEVHRVWVLEATVRPEWRHVYQRRVFYIDEDSWTALVSEAWDANGELWRVGVAYTKNYYELPGTLPVAWAFHDLRSGRYFVQGLGHDPDRAPRHGEPPAASRFTPSGLRRFVR